MIERYSAIRAEVRKPAYAGKTAAEILEAVTARDVSTLKLVTPQQITRLLQKRDKWHTIVMWAERVTLTPADAPTPETPSGSAAWVRVGITMRMVEAMNRRTDFDLSDAETASAISGGLAALMAVGFLSEQDSAAVLALANGVTSIAERDGYGDVTLDEIATELARGGE